MPPSSRPPSKTSQDSPRVPYPGRGRKTPRIVARRLPLYLAYINELAAEGRSPASSQEMARRLGWTPSLIRRDLSSLGRLGTAGIGYSVSRLGEPLSEALALKAVHRLAVIGTDERAMMVVNYPRLEQEGFEIAGVFHLGEEGSIVIEELTSQPLHELADAVVAKDIVIVAVAAPEDETPRMLERVAAVGVKAIVNLRPVSTAIPDGIIVYELEPLLALRKALAELSIS